MRARMAVLVSITLAMLGAGLALRTITAGAAAAGCGVVYKVTNQWQGGFGADVTVTYLGDPVSSWTLGWTFASGQSVTAMYATANGPIPKPRFSRKSRPPDNRAQSMPRAVVVSE